MSFADRNCYTNDEAVAIRRHLNLFIPFSMRVSCPFMNTTLLHVTGQKPRAKLIADISRD